MTVRCDLCKKELKKGTFDAFVYACKKCKKVFCSKCVSTKRPKLALNRRERETQIPTCPLCNSNAIKMNIPDKHPFKGDLVKEEKIERASIINPQTEELENWNNKPILLSMTEEQGKGFSGGGTVAGIGGSLGYSKLYRALKLDKCHKCKDKTNSYSFTDEEKTTIFCTKCGQKYQVIHPNTGKVWQFK